MFSLSFFLFQVVYTTVSLSAPRPPPSPNILSEAKWLQFLTKATQQDAGYHQCNDDSHPQVFWRTLLTIQRVGAEKHGVSSSSLHPKLARDIPSTPLGAERGHKEEWSAEGRRHVGKTGF